MGVRTVFATVPYYRRSLAPPDRIWNQIPDVVRQRIIGSRSTCRHSRRANSPRASPTRKAISCQRLRSLRKAYHRIKALPQAIPAPIAIMAIRSPG